MQVKTMDFAGHSGPMFGPQGFWGSGENGYLFSGSCGALVIIFRVWGSKRIVLGF